MNTGTCQTNFSNKIQEVEILKHLKQTYTSPLWDMPAHQDTQHRGLKEKQGHLTGKGAWKAWAAAQSYVPHATLSLHVS